MGLLYLSGRDQSGVTGAGGLGEGMGLEVEAGLAKIVCSQDSAVGMLWTEKSHQTVPLPPEE